MNQSEFLAFTCNLLKAREKIARTRCDRFGFASHRSKNWREIFWPSLSVAIAIAQLLSTVISKRLYVRNHALQGTIIKATTNKKNCIVSLKASELVNLLLSVGNRRHFSNSVYSNFELKKKKIDDPSYGVFIVLVNIQLSIWLSRVWIFHTLSQFLEFRPWLLKRRVNQFSNKHQRNHYQNRKWGPFLENPRNSTGPENVFQHFEFKE